MPTASELRALADQLEQVEEVAGEAAAAKAAYLADRGDPELKARHRAASQALNDARRLVREAAVVTAPSGPGSVAIRPGTVSGGVA